MLGYSQMWELVESVVKDEGYFLFDLDLPVGRKGNLRVFLTGEDGQGKGINLDKCAKVARRIGMVLDVNVEIVGAYVLEVSTPGINRRLRRPEHFKNSVGEHVKINVDAIGESKARSIYGTILSCDVTGVNVREDKQEETLKIPFSAIKEARIDFNFDNK
ncbi:MAG: ribosome maturation factor RimP [bacterium]|nr:ribosome maturation factor RimP [bacterium]